MTKLVADMTPEERENKNEYNRNYNANMTPEQKENKKEYQRNYYANVLNLTPEQKEERSERRKIRYANLTLEEKLEYKEHRRILRSTPESKKSQREYSKNHRAKQKANSPYGVYFIRDEHNRTKIGKSENITNRHIVLQTGNADELTLFAYIETPGTKQAKIAEVVVQDYFEKDWIRGEWYNISEEQIKMYAKNNKLYNIKICGFNRTILAA